MTHTHLSSLTDEELIRALQFDDNPQVSELVKRLELRIDQQESIEGDFEAKRGQLLKRNGKLTEVVSQLETDIEELEAA